MNTDVLTMCLQEKDDLYLEKARIDKTVKKIDTHVMPIALLLEADDISIKTILVTRYMTIIMLQPEVFLPRETLDKIKNKFGVCATKELLPSGELRITLTYPNGENVDIDSDGKVCLMQKNVTTKIIPEHTKEVVEYELSGPCEAWDATE